MIQLGAASRLLRAMVASALIVGSSLSPDVRGNRPHRNLPKLVVVDATGQIATKRSIRVREIEGLSGAPLGS